MNDDVSEYFGNLPLQKNVSKDERWASMFGSGVLVAAGLMKGSPLLLTGGLGLGFRALSGYCPVYSMLGTKQPEPAQGRLSEANTAQPKQAEQKKDVAQSNSK